VLAEVFLVGGDRGCLLKECVVVGTLKFAFSVRREDVWLRERVVVFVALTCCVLVCSKERKGRLPSCRGHILPQAQCVAVGIVLWYPSWRGPLCRVLSIVVGDKGSAHMRTSRCVWFVNLAWWVRGWTGHQEQSYCHYCMRKEGFP